MFSCLTVYNTSGTCLILKKIKEIVCRSTVHIFLSTLHIIGLKLS